MIIKNIRCPKCNGNLFLQEIEDQWWMDAFSHTTDWTATCDDCGKKFNVHGTYHMTEFKLEE